MSCNSELSSSQNQSLDVFIAHTRLSKCKAVDFLTECSWDVAAALKKFELEGAKDDSVTPSTSNDKMSYCELAVCQPPAFAFCLPDFGRFAPDFRDFLEKDLIETPTQRRLENSKHLNWWLPYGQRLYPLSTTGDGNCLLHAASLGIWGLHDRQLTLREALYEMLIRGSRRSALWRRWKWSEHKAYSEIGLRLSEEEWIGEWNNNIVAIASPVPRKTDDTSLDSNDQIYESLEAIHVFALAHVLKRPIIVVSDTVLRNAKGEELSPVPFGGVYLPLECPPEQCHRSPLVLCYDSAHFSPLVPMRHDSSQPQIIPITDVNRNLLPLHFAVDPGPDFTWWKDEDSRNARYEMTNSDRLTLMSQYMDLVRLDVRRGSIRRTLPIRSPSTNSTEKSLTLASSGMTNDTREKKRIMDEIRQQFMRTLRLSSRKNKQDGIEASLCASDLSRTSCVVASRLISSSHEYMDEMVREYVKTARERFQNNNQNSNNRKRMSRSFSASSIPITCINQSCDQPASQLCNFLCRGCFEHQKEMMMSFNCETARLAGLSINPKSNTMPTISTPPESVKSGSSSVRHSPVIPCKEIFDCQPTHGTPVLGVIKQGFTTTTTVSKVEGENGVTHYFVSGEEPRSSCALPSTSVLACSTALQQLAS